MRDSYSDIPPEERSRTQRICFSPLDGIVWCVLITAVVIIVGFIALTLYTFVPLAIQLVAETYRTYLVIIGSVSDPSIGSGEKVKAVYLGLVVIVFVSASIGSYINNHTYLFERIETTYELLVRR